MKNLHTEKEINLLLDKSEDLSNNLLEYMNEKCENDDEIALVITSFLMAFAKKLAHAGGTLQEFQMLCEGAKTGYCDYFKG